MDTKIGLALAGTASLLIAQSAFAYEHGKPGLWEVTAQMKFNSGGPPMPSPDQLAKMKEMGIQIPNMNAPHVHQTCVTPEQAASSTPPNIDERNTGCKVQNLVISHGSVTGETVCASGKLQGKGTMKILFDSDTHYAGTATFVGVSGAQPIDTTTTVSGHWLSDDCGAVKPMSAANP